METGHKATCKNQASETVHARAAAARAASIRFRAQVEAFVPFLPISYFVVIPYSVM